MQTVRRFCSSADSEIGRNHMPRVDGLTPEMRAMIAPRIVGAALNVWADVSDPEGGRYRFEHDHYLKLWALNIRCCPTISSCSTRHRTRIRSSRRWSMSRCVTEPRSLPSGTRLNLSTAGVVRRRHGDVLGRTRLHLSQSFRFGPRIADDANKWLHLLGSDMRLAGRGSPKSKIVSELANPNAVLCRNNATVIGELIKGLEAGDTVGLVGGGRDLMGVVWAAEALMAGRSTDHPEFALFKSWADLVEYAESGDDPNLLTLTKIVNTHGPAALKTAIDRAAPEERASLVLSTAHKAKGT